jgi:hypothetical protein
LERVLKLQPHFWQACFVTGLLGYEVNESTWGGIDAGYVQNFLSNDLKTLNLGDAKTAQRRV